MALLSKGKLSKMMLEVLSEFPSGTTNLKENVTLRLGMVGQMSTTRDINAAWSETKKKAANLYPEKFILDGRGVLRWNDGNVKILDKKISNTNYMKLNDLADSEGCSVDTLISRLISNYKMRKK
ncbi:MAG: hypothetical protein N838_10490 [Thiohalocapsa sp. PB-PSB1]|jgi:hypothetical protein|nr:MAG: hypothetical protein N838_10490 [Thiohalocapsa sp. PB-PSB1]